MALYDGYNDENENPYPGPNQTHPGANTGSGPWAPGYDPGPNWNGGVAPGPPSPRYDWNNGSPVDQALTPGHGWVWEGPQTPTWNMTTNQWDRGVWQERLGEGLGYTPAPAPVDTPKPGPTPTPTPSVPQWNGSVPAVGGGGGGYSGPSATLPPDIAALFGKVPERTPIQSAYQDALLKYMSRAQETPSLSDPTLAPQVEVFRAANQRATERNRRTAVERAGTGQSDSGYLDNVINQGVQQQGFNNASFNANLLGGEMNKRREELQAGLQLARATGDAEAARELQTRLAQVSAMMQQQGLNLQGQLGFGDLALRNRQVDMANDQFYDQLGINTQLSLEGLNQSALQKILASL